MISYTIIIPIFFISAFLSILFLFIKGNKLDKNKLKEEIKRPENNEELFDIIEKSYTIVSRITKPLKILVVRYALYVCFKIIYFIRNKMEHLADYIRGKNINRKGGTVSLFLEDLQTHKEKNSGKIYE